MRKVSIIVPCRNEARYIENFLASVAAQLGYTASRSASSLASGRTYTIGVVAPYIGRWFFGTVLDAAEQVFSAAGYDVLLYNLGSAEARKRFFTKLSVRKRVDAVLSLLIPDEDESAALRSLGVPLASTVGGARPGFTVVGIDDRAGAESAVRHLVNLGHRRRELGGRPIGTERRIRADRQVADEVFDPVAIIIDR